MVSVDAASRTRLGELESLFADAETTVVIDHHASNPGFGDLDFVDPHADCTAVLVLRVLDDLGVDLDEDIATCLYAGLITDTGSFRWARPESFRVAARLADAAWTPGPGVAGCSTRIRSAGWAWSRRSSPPRRSTELPVAVRDWCTPW